MSTHYIVLATASYYSSSWCPAYAARFEEPPEAPSSHTTPLDWENWNAFGLSNNLRDHKSSLPAHHPEPNNEHSKTFWSQQMDVKTNSRVDLINNKTISIVDQTWGWLVWQL